MPQPEPAADRRDDARLIAAMRRRMRDRRAIVTSQEAIRRSRDLLARFATGFP